MGFFFAGWGDFFGIANMPPENVLQGNCPEIESGGFWQLSWLPQVCVQATSHYTLFL